MLVTTSSSLKGKQLFPHEIVRSTTKSCNVSTLEDDVSNAQWGAIMRDLETQLAEAGFTPEEVGALLAEAKKEGMSAQEAKDASRACDKIQKRHSEYKRRARK